MNLLRFALQPRWLGYLALAVIFAVVTSLFGLWQWDRRGEAVAEIEAVNANFDHNPVTFAEVLPAGKEWSDDLRWLPVEMTGSYLSERQILVRTRSRAGQVGFEVLVPFISRSGETVLMNRGWVPSTGTSNAPESIPATPTGVVTVVGRLFSGEPEISGRSAPEGQVATIHLPTIATMTGLDIEERAYLALVQEDPPVSPTPLVLDRPVPDEGPHLSYTVQWFLFGILGFVAWGYLLREEYRGGRSPRTRSGKLSDSDLEDQLIDQWGSGR